MATPTSEQASQVFSPPTVPLSNFRAQRDRVWTDGRLERTRGDGDGGRRNAPRRDAGELHRVYPPRPSSRQGRACRLGDAEMARTHPRPRETDGGAWTPEAPRPRRPSQSRKRGAYSQPGQLAHPRPRVGQDHHCRHLPAAHVKTSSQQ
eukprot:4387159-Pleurochrysis_carterae.AAC.1